MKKKGINTFFIGILFIFLGLLIYNKTLLSENTLGYFPMKMFVCRIFILICLMFFLILHVWMGVKSLYEHIHKYRYLIGCIILLGFVLCKFNFSSIGMYDIYIETGKGSQFCQPVFGQPRAIRSDEWLVTTPRVLSGQYSTPAYSEENDIVMAKETSNLSTTGFQLGLCMLSSPHNWLYATGNVAYGLSFRWGFLLIFGMLMSYDFFLIITDGKKLISCTGMILVMFSSIFMWWSYMIWLVYAFASIDIIYYFIKYEETWKRILLAFGLVIAASAFCVELYPAWQVPLGYFVLGMIIWILISNKNQIKKLRAKDITIMFCAFVLLIGVLLSYLHENMQYIKDVMQTVYPGHREAYGSYTLNELFYYLQTVLYPFIDIGNSSEAGVFYNFFPIPLLLSIYLWLKNKDRKQDKLTPILLIISFLLGGYCCFEYPHTLAKVLLLTYSMPERMADIFGFVQVIILVYLLGKYEVKDMLSPIFAFFVSAITIYISAYICKKSFPEYLNGKQMILLCVFGFTCLFCILVNSSNHNYRQWGCIVLMLGVFVSGVCVHPLMRGVNALYSKPLEKKISSIVKNDSDGVWLGMDNPVLPSVLIANGAPTLDCVNYVPNFELWEKIDPDKHYEEIWNRYAHVGVEFTDEDTAVSLVQPDVISIQLSYKDIPDTKLNYIVCAHELESNKGISFKKMYCKNGFYIYHVGY